MNFKKIIFSFIFTIFLIVLIIDSDFQIPVIGAKKSSYNQLSYWYYPWGKSVTHKGVDIFAKVGTPIIPANPGFVLKIGNNELGGNYVLILSAKWRLHYYAHLDRITTSNFSFVGANDTIGTVGTSGNAKGKKPHLHYTIRTLIPYFWQIDNDRQGWKKMFYINPIISLNEFFEIENIDKLKK